MRLLAVSLMLLVMPLGHAHEKLHNLMFLPEKGDFLIEISNGFRSSEIEYSLDDLNYESEEVESLFTQYALGYSLSRRHYLELKAAHYYYSKFDESSDLPERRIIETTSKGINDPTLTYVRRFAAKDEEFPLMDLIFFVSPESGDAKVAAPYREGNVKKGGTDSGVGFRFGLSDPKYDASGQFFIKHFGEKEKTRLSDNSKIKLSEYSALGLGVSAQYTLADSWSFLAEADVQLDSNYTVKTQTSTVEADRGITTTLSLGARYIVNPNFLIGILGTQGDSSYELSFANEEDEISYEYEQIMLSLKLLL